MATNIFYDNYMWDTISQFFGADSYDNWDNTKYAGQSESFFTDALYNSIYGTNGGQVDLNAPDADMNEQFWLNIDNWQNEWMNSGYLPVANKEDYDSISSVGLIDKKNKIDNIFAKGYSAGNDLFKRAIQGDNTYSSFIYDRALASGRLSDFSIYNDEKDFERAFEADLFSSIGNMAELGAFDLTGYEQS